MQALKLREHVKNGQIVITIPKEFGPVVEIILLAPSHDEIEFWQEDEIQNLGKTRTLVKDLDEEDYLKLMQGRQIGFDKGLAQIADDFNAPLDEFKEYMSCLPHSASRR